MLDLELQLFNPPSKDKLITASSRNEYRSSDPWDVRVMFASAVAFAPDSIAKPVLGRFPYDVDGGLIDTIWQKWLLQNRFQLIQRTGFCRK